MATSTLLHQRSPLDNSPFRMTRNAAMATVQDEAEWVAGHYNSDDGDDAVEVSMRSAASRDTSNTSRTNIDLDNTRQSTTSASRDVSILDLSRHDDDDDEDDDNDDEVGQEVQDTNLECWGADDSIMFEELHVEDGVQEHPSTTENDVDMASRNCRSPTAHISSFPAASPSNETPSSSKEEPGSTSQPSSPGILGMGALSLSSVTDTLVDSICVSSSVVDSTSSLGNLVDLNKGSGTSLSSIAVPVLNCNWNRSTGGDGRSDSCNRNLSPAIADFWQLLGCSTQPSSAELDELWSLRTGGMLHETEQHETAKRPVRSSIKKRLKRLHSLRMLSHGIHGATRHGVTFADQPQNCSFTSIGGSSTASNGTSGLGGGGKARVHSKAFSQPFTLDKAYSMLDDPLADMIGPGMDPILAADDGYDSDPEVNCSNTMDSPAQQQQDHHHQQQARVMFSLASSELDAAIVSSGEEDIEHRHRSQMEAPTNHTSMSHVDPYWLEDQEVRRSVRATMNSTWTLTWHPNPDNMKEFSISHKPVCTNIWLERGTVVTNAGVVIEPAFMWRDAYQPNLSQRRQLNASTQKPWNMRLLNVCRITPCPASTPLDRSKYPFARQSSCFFLKSCKGQEFLLEAQSPEEATLIAHQWKMAVARFASLAVTEDVSGIANEFFHPTLDAQVLTAPDEDF